MDQATALANSIVDYLNGRGNLVVKPYELSLIKTDLDETFPEMSFAFDFRRNKFRIVCFSNNFNIWIDATDGEARFLTYEEVEVG